ncbi:ABC transporter substrate-binding protein [Corynebacterium hadale]|uniref:ABC transporter substrate-binding protein n=1 Tax=Corynebacterium hadale TaxID=2026255 RepID=A0AB36RHG4_9CORY|nr:ABC transporter substrate-binding protein [Corynebacterium hadale]PAT09085.1 ABC transporter substrate-binding protein [Corynebacterium hadale]TVX79899.1 extracellular solute-binding protein [Corynebacterium sp. NML180780]
MFKPVAALLTVAAVALPLAACSSSDGESGDDPIVIYSNSTSDGRGEWLTDQASEAGFNIEFVDLGGGDVQDRLVAEKANPIADVVFGLNNVYFENIKAEDVLESYTPSWSDKVEAGLGDDDTYWPIVREPIMLVYNDAAFTEADAPKDWSDLWEQDRFHDRYEVASGLGGATTQMVIAGILSRYLDENGDLGVSDEGWKAIEAYYKNGQKSVKGTDLYARMQSGEIDAGQMWLAGKASREKEYGIKTSAVHPSTGVPMATQHVAKVAGSDNPKVEEFIDWFGSADVQASWSREFFTAPVNEDALADADQTAVEETDSFTAQDIDWQIVAENLSAWVEKIELQYL